MRTKPYTVRGIKRIKCFRCGAQAYSTWQIYADGGQYRPICKACDVALNEMALKFMGFPDWEEKMRKYKEQLPCG